jgi:hypothetical protein
VAKTATVMSIARHPAVPAPPVDGVVMTFEVAKFPAFGGGVLLLTTLGVTYLPIPYDLRTFAGMGIGGIAGVLGFGIGHNIMGVIVEEAGKALGETVVQDRVMPDRIKASLRSKGAFAAGYAEIVSVGYSFSWISRRLILEIEQSGAVSSYAVHFDREVTNEQIETIANNIAHFRVLAEFLWICEDALASFEAEAGNPGRPPRLLYFQKPFEYVAARLLRPR